MRSENAGLASWNRANFQWVLVWSGLLCVGCGLTVDEGAGKRCDELHPCRADRWCVEGRCTDSKPSLDSGLSLEPDAGVVPDASTGSDASVADAGRQLDAGMQSDAGSNAMRDAGTPDAGAMDAGTALGQACARDGQCASGICSQSVCCTTRCDGACQSCASGMCLLRPVGAAGIPACFAFNGCNGTQSSCPSACISGSCAAGLRCNNGACVKKTDMLSLTFDNGWSPQMNAYTFGGSPAPASINKQVHLTNPANQFAGTGIESVEVFDFEESSVLS